MRKLSHAIISQIRSMLSSGNSSRLVASKLGVSQSTIIRYSRSLKLSKKKRVVYGRSRKLSKRLSAYIVRLFETGLLKNANDAKISVEGLLKETISKWTIARTLQRSGLKSYSKPKKPRLTPIHKKIGFNLQKPFCHFQMKPGSMLFLLMKAKSVFLGLMVTIGYGVVQVLHYLIIILHPLLNLEGNL